MKLSPTMEAALALARANGGKLQRHPGGFWAGPDFQIEGRAGRVDPWFGTQTIMALVDRGLAVYSARRPIPYDGRPGGREYPVEITLVP